MRHTLNLWFALTLATLFLFSEAAFSQAGTCSGMTVGQLTSLNGFVPFQSTSLWNTDISAAPVDPNSANYINFIGPTVTLHPDFGAGTFHNQTLGIPYQVVAGTQAKVPVTLGAFFDESDPGPEPIPSNALIEGFPKPGNGDRHVLVLEKDGCWLYELFNAALTKGKWSADATAIWDMTINEQRPYTWTSADAAGLPGLLVWHVSTKLPREQSITLYALPFQHRKRRSSFLPRIGPQPPLIRMLRLWGFDSV
jgi:hypothetical protein